MKTTIPPGLTKSVSNARDRWSQRPFRQMQQVAKLVVGSQSGLRKPGCHQRHFHPNTPLNPTTLIWSRQPGGARDKRQGRPIRVTSLDAETRKAVRAICMKYSRFPGQKLFGNGIEASVFGTLTFPVHSCIIRLDHAVSQYLITDRKASRLLQSP